VTGPLLTARELDQPGREKCPKCGGALVWSNNRLIGPRRSCDAAEDRTA
jgi:hypothetical protein